MNCANHPERERTAFCQNCGKPLCQECTRVVGTAIYCEPCLASKISGAAPPPSSGPYPDPGPNYAAAGAIPPLPPTGAPNPGLAALLGFIPGVGAMYNGQFAKGVVHLIVFAVLVSLADNSSIFGIFVAGWVFYQVFEAYQTAVARRDGTPLPNPFGLNDLGERLGFGKSWASGGTSTPVPPPADAYVPPANPYTPPAAAPFAPAPGATQQPWEMPWQSYTPPAANPYMNPPVFDPGAYPAPRNRFPVGAIWLIGLGVLFLVGNAGIFHGFPHIFLPLFLIMLGVWIFYNKMTATGSTLANDGSAFYRMRLFCALRGSIWVILVGVMFFLAEFRILPFGRSWPLFIIVAGLMVLAEKTVYSSVPATPAYPPYQAPPAASTSSVVPPSTLEDTPGQSHPNQNDQEGR
ncbi:MAG: B-box zinc finger protein [Acidobacteria bacterium]|nr:B-box zinc finger protein [Acidobacteriota bacterium]